VKTFDLAPEFADRVRRATRETRFTGTADLPGFFRKPYGKGWVLVGDAGHHKDPVTALGISDAFRDADAVSAALDDVFSGRRPYDAAMAACHTARDAASFALYGLTCQFAKNEPPPPEMQQLLGAVSQSREASDDFVSVMAKTFPVPEFFSPDNAARIMGDAMRTAPS
jgi:2-polyprenyl-6-methoxyphenol hydroxylase-like FAD-dependent oxidoreductase